MKSPQELIDHVVSIVQQKVAKNMRCFYSIKVHKNDATTELIDRKAAGEEFLPDLQNIISVNKPDTVIVELYKGSSRKVKVPESEFYINLTGREVSFPVKAEPLGGVDTSLVISEMRRNFDQQIQGVRELTGLHSSLTIAQLELKHAQARVKELEDELATSEEYIEKLEGEIKSRPQLNGPGGLNILQLGSYWLEGILRRNPGLVAGALGVNESQVKGMFTNSDQTSANSLQPGNATATFKVEGENKQLTENEQKRVQIVEAVAGFLRQLSDYHLATVYQLMSVAAKDLSALEKMKAAVGVPTDEQQQNSNNPQ